MSPSPPPAPVRIKSVRRRMRGGSQAHLVECWDGTLYVAKFAGNPQGTRTLINEWICYRLLQRIGVCTPDLQVLELTDETVQRTPDFHFTTRTTIPIATGLHLGSRCPADPEKVAIFDILPTNLLAQLVNRKDFWKMLAVDVLTGQADSRQVIFIRDRRLKPAQFQAYFIDHGYAFGGSEWNIRDSALAGRYHNPTVYVDAHTCTALNIAVCSLEEFSEQDFYQCLAETPEEWWQLQDVDAIAALWLQLQRRQSRLRTLLDTALRDLRDKNQFRSALARETPDNDLSIRDSRRIA